MLLPLLDCRDGEIREGIRALLAEREEEAEALASRCRKEGWTAFQMADRVVRDGLRASRARWAEYRDRPKRAAALERFHQYACQWY